MNRYWARYKAVSAGGGVQVGQSLGSDALPLCQVRCGGSSEFAASGLRYAFFSHLRAVLVVPSLEKFRESAL